MFLFLGETQFELIVLRQSQPEYYDIECKTNYYSVHENS